MIYLSFALIFGAFALCCPLTGLMRHVGVRLGQVDRPGERKIHGDAIPATGGVAIFLAIAIPLAGAFLAGWLLPVDLWPAEVTAHLPGLRGQTPLALTLLGGALGLHVIGLIDDRRPLGPWIKLLVQIVAAGALVAFFNVRLLELLGPVPSILVSILWFVIIINAFNFLDNMDGLSGGVGCICAGLFFASALLGGQWFIAALLGLLMGALGGFLVFNFPPARIFMGDSGSLVVGYLLAFCSVRITYFDSEVVGAQPQWWALFAPLIVLAIPLYDFASVVLLRLSQGRNPLVGDTQHFSHRLVRKGLSRRAAVGMIWAAALAAGLSGVMLPYLEVWQALLAAAQTAAILFVLALLEMKTPSANEL